MKDDTKEVCLYLGYLLCHLLSQEGRAPFVALLQSDEEGRDRVWRYTRRLRDELTALLHEAGRE